MSGECNICGKWGCVEYNHIKWLKVTPSKLNQLINKAEGDKFTLDKCPYKIIELDKQTGELVVQSFTEEEFNITIYNK